MTELASPTQNTLFLLRYRIHPCTLSYYSLVLFMKKKVFPTLMSCQGTSIKLLPFNVVLYYLVTPSYFIHVFGFLTDTWVDSGMLWHRRLPTCLQMQFLCLLLSIFSYFLEFVFHFTVLQSVKCCLQRVSHLWVLSSKNSSCQLTAFKRQKPEMIS